MRILEEAGPFLAGYDALLCDIWGVVHNGLRAHPGAMAALQAYRAQGGRVALITNAPRPASSVAAQMRMLGAPDDCYDVIVTSGDATRAALGSGDYGRRCFHIGALKDMPVFEGLDVERVALEEAEFIFCTGLRDDVTETPEDYADLIAQGIARGLKLLCANPDIVVDVGDERRYCAGAIAQAYALAGGEAVYFGKPHPPIYAQSIRALGGPAPQRALAIGDGIVTDVPGARINGFDCLFITGGLAAHEVLGASGMIDPPALAAFLERHNEAPLAAMAQLR